MNENDIVGLVITLLMMCLLLALGIMLLTGRGAFLISGYNTMSKRERERYDQRALCKFVGKLLIAIALMMPCGAIGSMFDIHWINTCVIIVILVLCIGAVIYANTGNRFKK